MSHVRAALSSTPVISKPGQYARCTQGQYYFCDIIIQFVLADVKRMVYFADSLSLIHTLYITYNSASAEPVYDASQHD